MPSKEAPLVSVVIVNYNGKPFLDKCISSLLRQTYANIEIILVDNASFDGSIELVKNRYPRVRLICNFSNLGFAAGNNVGISASRGEFIATLNNDAEADQTWIERLIEPMDDPAVGMCASKMLLMKEPDRINSTGLLISRSGACWDRGIFEKDKGQYCTKEEVFGPSAGAAMYRKSMIDQVGAFDVDFFMYMEDADLTFRGRAAGWKCIYVPDAIVRHYFGGSSGHMSRSSIYYGDRNIVWNVIKNYPLPLLIICLPWIVGRNVAIVPIYILKGYGLVIVKSKLDAILGIPGMVKKRCKAPDYRSVYKFMKTWASIPPKK